jgi:uncharacterized protein (DUF488 family)
MRTIYTIGHTKKSLEHFIGLLRDAGVDGVIDIRLRNTSQLTGFAKRDDLAFLLREGFGMAYEHRPELAPTPEILDSYKDDGDWSAYERDFLHLLAERGATAIGREILARYRHPCLLCAEPVADYCHRRLVAEWWAEELADVEVSHLG